MTSTEIAYPRVQFALGVLPACKAEVRNTFPRESGGVLMGRSIGPGSWLVDFAIGPGPLARHAAFRFSPDLPWQHDRIADRFRSTHGQSTYIGDWHSHPRARDGQLSQLDIRTMKKIMASPEAMCSEPLMVILWSGDPHWSVSAWSGRSVRRRFLGRRFELRACAVSGHE